MLLRGRKTPNVLNHESKREPRPVAIIPAFRHSFLTPFYDSVMKYAARELAFKPRLVEQGMIKRDHRILDLGCGTATLTILIKKTEPEAEVIGLDADSNILEIAKVKVAKAGVDIRLEHAMAYDLPYSDNSFDRVFSSMVFHHLSIENKARTLREIFRVLKPSGTLHTADFGKPQNTLMNLSSLIIRRLEEAKDNVNGLLPEMIRTAGFKEVEEKARVMTLFGTIALYKARKPVLSAEMEVKMN